VSELSVPPEIVKCFAPTGILRAAINLGNPILANRDPVTGEPVGVSIDLARAFAQRLGVPIELAIFDAAGKSVDAVTQERADIGFFAVDPLRGAGIAFTAPYVLIEGCYLVPEASDIRHNEDVDRLGHTVVVGQGANCSRRASYARPPRPRWLTLSRPCAPMWQRASSSSLRPMPIAWAGCACWTAALWSSGKPWAHPRAAGTRSPRF